MTQSIKQTIREISALFTGQASVNRDPSATTTPLIDLMRPWLVITGLDFKDVVHLSSGEMWSALERVHAKVGGILDVLDDDQLRETACRMIGSVTLHEEDPVVEDGVVLHGGTTISWDGSAWQYVSDPKLRMRDSTKTYAEALSAVRGRTE